MEGNLPHQVGSGGPGRRKGAGRLLLAKFCKAPSWPMVPWKYPPLTHFANPQNKDSKSLSPVSMFLGSCLFLLSLVFFLNSRIELKTN
jgi:hypothetical protein